MHETSRNATQFFFEKIIAEKLTDIDIVQRTIQKDKHALSIVARIDRFHSRNTSLPKYVCWDT